MLILRKTKALETLEKDDALFQKQQSTNKALSPAKLEHFASCGCDQCPLQKEWNKLSNPKMEMTKGSDICKILIVGEAPGKNEDEQGIQFIGKAGELIREVLGDTVARLNLGWDWTEKHVYWTNTVRCRPPGNRTPTPQEIACCSSYLKEDIDVSDPPIILGLGSVPLNALSPAGKLERLSIEAYRGVAYPLLHESRTRIFISSFHPSFLQRIEDERDGAVYTVLFKDDIRAALDEIDTVLPHINWQAVLFPFYRKESVGGNGWYQKSGLVMIDGEGGVQLMENTASTLLKSEVLGFDIETDQLRPYNNGKLLSFSFSDGIRTLSVAVDHPSVTDGAYKQKAMEVLRRFILQKHAKILAHNLGFELEWMGFFFGNKVFNKVGSDNGDMYYGDTMGLKRVLPASPSSKLLSLEDVCLQVFGFDLKGMYSLDRSRLSSYCVSQVLEYNAADAIVLPLIDRILRKYLEYYNVVNTYTMLINATICASKAQVDGLPANKSAAEDMRNPLLEERAKFVEKMDKGDLVKNFIKEKGRKPNYNSSDDMQYILYNMYNLEVIEHKKTKRPTADKTVLALYAKVVPDLADIVDLKELDRFTEDVLGPVLYDLSKKGDTIIYKDGRMHTQFRLHSVQTMRSSSTGPNVQNIPKRNPKFSRARDIIGIPLKDLISQSMLGADSGQIDFRLAGMSCLDPNFIKATREGFDVHGEMAKHVAKLSPEKFAKVAKKEGVEIDKYDPNSSDELTKVVLKSIRQDVKSGLVFARIYRAGLETIAKTLGVSKDVAEELSRILDEMFPGIRLWHEDLYSFYERNAMIRSIAGTLLYGPMGFGEVANYGIQHATRFIVSGIMKRLSVDFKLCVPNEVHDEVLVLTTQDEEESVIQRMAEVFCVVPYEWAHVVPLACEVKKAERTETGLGWGSMKKVAEYSSVDFGWQPQPVEDFQRFYDMQFQKVVRKPVIFI